MSTPPPNTASVDRWTSPGGAVYARAALADHPVAWAAWARQDTGSAPSSTFSVARPHPTITITLGRTGHVDVAVRPAGVVIAASSSVRAIVGVDLHPWLGPQTAHHLAGRIDVNRIAERMDSDDLAPAMRLLVRRSVTGDRPADPTVVAVISSILTAGRRGPAAVLDISERSIRRLVRSTTDLTPIRLRRIARAAGARRLLQSPGQSLADIAQVAGYSDQSHMTHDFRELCGYTPGQWRRHTASWTPTPSRG